MNANTGKIRISGQPGFTRLLVPTDFSAHAARALRYAVPLARRVGGTITLLHVIEWPVVPAELSGWAADESEFTGQVKRALDALAVAQVPAGVRGPTLVRIGRAHQEIVRAARSTRAHLIVIATKGRTGLRRALLGSTAERVVRHATCPVLTLRGVPGARPPGRKTARLAPRVNRILVPVDFSSRSRAAVRYASGLARAMGARLALLHVAPPLPVGLFRRFPDELARCDAEALREARRKLDALAALVPRDLRVEVRLRREAVAPGILRAARDWRSDLMVLPTRGLTGVKYIVLGSVAEAVVRQAPCPVLTLARL